MGEIEKAKTLKAEIEGDISRLLATYEKNIGLVVNNIGFVRQPIYDDMGNETDYRYVVEPDVKL